MIERISIAVRGQGLHSITENITTVVSACGLKEGLCTLFIRHTSASLLIQENYDDSARVDLERWLNRLVPENDSLYTHTLEGPDDMTSHIRMALTRTSEVIPISEGRMVLGTWQGIFLFEHRLMRHTRQLAVNVTGV